ncbi:hypothetical protein HYH02_006604 [Chlamydomonas schloesseri]|uniref:EGF-like domain-containing protein n=1 Tax=Chlamydomonas schloesseri TaxID=2026947 RepID=A0A835W3D2_9CHLO|nr:hypothetical protein HYH02_006604 [Chlamydomonas schloesseri]|eukprot:KAG2439077.1 hypothetical protein HYH02_006604 [Chlamydomonas schloesseri]
MIATPDGFVHASVAGSADLICVRDGSDCQEKDPYLFPTLHTSCHDADGCHAGWTWDAALAHCVDVDECAPGSPYNRCGDVAECINIVGNHVCVCPQLQDTYGGTYEGRYRFDRESQRCIDDTASPPCVWPQFRFGGQCVDDPCQFKPCGEHERCISAPDGTDYFCACKGRRVDGVCKLSPCLTSPCPEPWATCYNNDDWRGRRCAGSSCDGVECDDGEHCNSGVCVPDSDKSCNLPESWCDGDGEILAKADCGDGDGIDDWACFAPSTGRRAVLLSSNCSAGTDYWPDAPKALCPPLFNNLTCPLPWDEWCTDPGYVRRKLDCGDGDGIDDWTCTRPALGQRGVLLSSDCDAGDRWPEADVALCPPLFNRTICPLPSDDWCRGEGLLQEQLDCGDGDAVPDWVCHHNVTFQRKVLLSSNCSTDHWPQADTSLCPPRFASMPCPQPDNWCDGAGEVSELSNCGDGDSIGDWTCIAANTSRRAVLLSTTNCTLDYWPEAPKSMCPPRFNALMCPLPWDDWCVGDNLVRSKVNCGDDPSTLDWVCVKTNTSGRGVLLSTNCSESHWPDADKSLCPAAFSDLMCPLPWDDWCVGDNLVRSKVNCGDGDAILDWACVQTNTSWRGVLLSSSDCADSHWPDAEKSLCPTAFNGLMCPLPGEEWCTGPGDVREKVDCGDGDAILDWACVQTNTSWRGVLLSSSDCADSHWPDAEKSLCPTAFDGLMCPLPGEEWCTGPGDVREKVDCGDDSGVLDWVCTHPANGQRGVLLSSSDCSDSHWPYANKTLCPARFSDAPCPVPGGWCEASEGEVLHSLDCGDGDGVGDWACVHTDTSRRAVLLSSGSCNTDDAGWPTAVRSMCPPLLNGMMCPLPYGWCEAGDGAVAVVLQRVNCGDGDGIDDWVCSQPATGQRKVLLSSSNCSVDYWPQADAALCPPVFNRSMCAMPYNWWCSGDGFVLEQLDCGDGDSVDDWVCIHTPTGQRKVLLSSSNCSVDYWPTADRSLCPNRFNSAVCPMPYDWWCSGDGLVLEKTDCGDGDAVDDWVCVRNETGQRKVLLSSSNCSVDYWPQAERSLCPKRFNSSMCPMPYDWWCSGDGYVLERTDCGDGDGVLDWTCIHTPTGQRKVLLSSGNCSVDYWPQADKSLCPARFNQALCPMPYTWWCSGDGFELKATDCGDGDGINDWVCVHNATGQRKVLLSSSNCSVDYWPTADKSLCPPVFNQAVCPMPYGWWCAQAGGDVLEQLDCDLDGVPDWLCTNPDSWMRKVLLSSDPSNCTQDYGPAAPRSLCPSRLSKAMCYWPWGDSCSGESYTRQRADCGDGDGIDDWTCVQHNSSYRGVLLSSSACDDSHWRDADKSLCMPVFKDLPCALPWDGWCVGENLVRAQADCGDGDAILDWMCIETNTSRRGVLLSSNCTVDHWGDPDKSLCPAKFQDMMCPLPYYWCDQPGEVLERVPDYCGDGDAIPDWVCTNPTTGQRKLLLSSSDCSNDHAPQADTSLCPARWNGTVCPQPDWWCTDTGEHLERVDCGDGDGVDDWVCLNPSTGQRRVLLSSRCTLSGATEDFWPQADKSLCPNRFNSEPCPQPNYWCSGEGMHIEQLDCGDGDSVPDWVCLHNATGQRAVLLSSGNCSTDYWPQADKSLCPKRFDSLPCPQPYYWCTDSTLTLESVDCADGDSVPDWTCIQNTTNQRAVLLSSGNCSVDYWDTAPISLCPTRFASEYAG